MIKLPFVHSVAMNVYGFPSSDSASSGQGESQRSWPLLVVSCCLYYYYSYCLVNKICGWMVEGHFGSNLFKTVKI